MSLGWKKFNFFDKEERQEQEVPDSSTCSCSSADQLFFGCSDGRVSSVHFVVELLSRTLLKHNLIHLFEPSGCFSDNDLGRW